MAIGAVEADRRQPDDAEELSSDPAETPAPGHANPMRKGRPGDERGVPHPPRLPGGTAAVEQSLDRHDVNIVGVRHRLGEPTIVQRVERGEARVDERR